MISEQVLNARMAELGRIKIGGLDKNVRTTGGGKKWQMPVKFDHFVITGQERDSQGNFVKDESIHALVGPEPKELKIRLLYNDLELNFRTELACYSGKTCLCRGDGKTAEQLDQKTSELVQVNCPCPKLTENKCKPHGVLNCILEEASICGGVHRFSTTGWNSIRSIVSSLKFIQACNGGIVAGIPLVMKYFKKTTTTKDGKPTTIPVVTIIYMGSPVQMLETAIKTEKERIQAGVYMSNIEQQARIEMKQSSVVAVLEDDEIPEFHPEIEEDQQETVPVKTIDDVANQAKEETISKPEPKKTTKTKKTDKEKEPTPKPDPIPEPEPKADPTPEPKPETKKAGLDLAEAHKAIMRARAKNRIDTATLKELLKSAGVESSIAAEWTEEEANKILGAIAEKYEVK